MNLELFSADFYIILGLVTAPWIIFSLFSSFGDAAVGYIDEWLLKKLSKEGAKNVDAPGRLLLISGFFGLIVSLGAFIFTIFSETYTLNVSTNSMLLAIGAGVLELTWMIPYFYALNRGGAVNTTPLFQSIPIFSLIFGITIFNDVPTIIQIIATVLIITGAIILNYSPEAKRLDIKSILLMFLSSAIVSLSFFLFKDASLSGNFVATLFGNGLGMGMLSLAIWTLWPPYRRQFNDFIKSFNLRILGLQLANESLYAVSTIASQLAIVLGPSIMVVSSLNAFHPIFTLLIGLVLAKTGSKQYQKTLGGKNTLTKTLAILLIALGTFIIIL